MSHNGPMMPSPLLPISTAVAALQLSDVSTAPSLSTAPDAAAMIAELDTLSPTPLAVDQVIKVERESTNLSLV